MENKTAYGCNPYSEPKKRCYELKYVLGDYDSLQECLKNCFPEEQKKALDVLRKYEHKIKTIPELVQPTINKIITKVKDIPLINTNIDVSQKIIDTLYKSAQPDFAESPFLKKLAHNKNVYLAKTIFIDTSDLRANPSSLNNTQEFIANLKIMKERNHIFMLIDIDHVTDTGRHAITLLVKRNNDTYKVYFYDPLRTFKERDIIVDLLDKTITNIVKKTDMNITFVNLSSFYGIQLFESFQLLNPTTLSMITNMIAKKCENLIIDSQKMMNDPGVYNAIFGPKMREEMTKNLTNHLVENGFGGVEKDNTITIDLIKNISGNFVNNFFVMPFPQLFTLQQNVNTILNGNTEVRNNVLEITRKISDIQTKILSQIDIKIFNQLCYAWSVYSMCLIIMNPTIDPYDIIKLSFFQTDDLKEMTEIYEKFKLLQNIFQEGIDIFNYEWYDKLYNLFVNNESELIRLFNTIANLKHIKILYHKITNLIITMSKYMYNENKNKFMERINEINSMNIPHEYETLLDMVALSNQDASFLQNNDDILKTSPTKLIKLEGGYNS